jgi:hypothetical protein
MTKSQHRARHLVDCSGRRAVVVRSLGVQTAPTDDRLFAYAQWFSCCGNDDDRYTRIEAVPHGWRYSNRLPGLEGNEIKRLEFFSLTRTGRPREWRRDWAATMPTSIWCPTS